MGNIPIELMVAVVTSSLAALSSIVVAIINLLSNRDVKSYRKRREEEEAIRNDLHIGTARVMLMEFYKHAMKKGYYTAEERDVYHPLFLAYKAGGGDGVIDDLEEKIVQLPTFPSKNDIDSKVPRVF